MIKIIAYISMFVDHTGRVFFPNLVIPSIVGRIAFPLFAWGVATGLKRTRNFKLYTFRVFLLAIISEVPYLLLFETNYLNVCFTLLDGMLIIKLLETNFFVLKWPVILLLLVAAEILNFEYGIYGVLTIILFYFIKNKYLMLSFQIIVTIISIYIYNYKSIQVYSILSLFLVIFLQKYDFKINRFIQYSFYPAHMIFLLLLEQIFPR
ncbi:TraX family protein [Paenibacillus sp. BAC0078]